MTAGSFVFILGFNGIAVHHSFVPSGLYGFAVFSSYVMPNIDTSVWYLLFNGPIFLLAWKGVGRRFFWLNLFCMGVVTLLTATLHLDFGIRDRMCAAIASGALMGAGAGIILRSYGAGGGLDIVAVMLHHRYNIRFGVFYFLINACLMTLVASRFEPDLVVASLVVLFINSVATEYALSLFNQRKSVVVMSARFREIADKLTERGMRATIIRAEGAYSGREANMLYCITDNLRLKTLEGLVFDEDPDAIFIVENTFNVFGADFSPRKVYE
nr:YitT family protein [Desulfobaculum xiamenense]